MASTTGVQPLVNYASLPNDPARVQALLALIPNPDSTSTSGAQAGGAISTNAGYLDEMSPAAATQLQVELAALAANVS